MSTYTASHRRYYLTKVKPFRKVKKEKTAYHSFSCPVCGKRSFMRNFDRQYPLFDVKMWIYGGYCGIKLVPCGPDGSLEQFKNLLKVQVLRIAPYLGLRLEEKRFGVDERLGLIALRNYAPARIAIPIRMEVS